jgi:hypothetical protein
VQIADNRESRWTRREASFTGSDFAEPDSGTENE